jgi:hypothetical protein
MRRSTASGFAAAAAGSGSIRRHCAGVRRWSARKAVSTWSSTSRTDCPSSHRWQHAHPWSAWSITCIGSSGPSCSARWRPGSAGASSRGYLPGSTAARQYVAVSGRTKDELAELGVDPSHIAVIHNGTDEPTVHRRGQIPSSHDRGPRPPRAAQAGRACHRRTGQARRVAPRLNAAHHRRRLVGSHSACPRRGVRGHRPGGLLGFVSEERKHAELAAAWVALAPSIKEGWGLNVVEAASHGVPTVAYHGAGGLSESIEDGLTGLLVQDLDAMAAAVSKLLSDQPLRDSLGRRHANMRHGSPGRQRLRTGRTY